MGLFPELIEANREKKQQDWQKQWDFWSHLSGVEQLAPDARQVAYDNLATLAGGELGLPKQHHGTLGKLMAGMHDHLVNLNPNPKDDWKGKMQALPQPGKAAVGPIQKLAGGDQVTSSLPDQKMPDAPAYHPISEDNARRYKMQQAQDESSMTAATEAAKFEQGQVEARQKVANLKQLLDSGDISKMEYSQGVADIMSGVKLSMGGAAGRTKPANVQIADPTAPDGKKWIPVEQGWDDNGSVEYRRLAQDGERGEVVKALAIGPPPRSYDRDPRYYRLMKAAKAVYPNASEQEIDTYVGKQIELEEAQSLMKGQLTLSGKSQDIGIKAGERGVGGGATGPGLPTPPPSAQIQTGTPPTTGTPKPVASGAPPAQLGALPQAQGQKPTTPTMPKVDSTSPKAGGSPVAVQHWLDSTDEGVRVNAWLMKGAPISMLKGAGSLPLLAGAKQLMAMTGMNLQELQDKGVARISMQKQRGMLQSRLAAYGTLGLQINKLGYQMVNLRSELPANSPRWRKIKDYLLTGYTDDPLIAKRLTAANEFNRSYARFASSAGLSAAQTHTGMNDTVDKLIDPAFNTDQLQGVVDIVRRGTDIDADADKAVIKQMDSELAKGWKEFDPANIIPPAPKEKKVKRQTRKMSDGSIQTRQSTDDGKTWQVVKQ